MRGLNWIKLNSKKSYEERFKELNDKLDYLAIKLGIGLEINQNKNEEVEPTVDDKPSKNSIAENDIKTSFKTDFDEFLDTAHQQMMRVTIMRLETAEKIDIEQLRMEQLKAMRLKRIG